MHPNQLRSHEVEKLFFWYVNRIKCVSKRRKEKEKKRKEKKRKKESSKKDKTLSNPVIFN